MIAPLQIILDWTLLECYHSSIFVLRKMGFQPRNLDIILYARDKVNILHNDDHMPERSPANLVHTIYLPPRLGHGPSALRHFLINPLR